MNTSGTHRSVEAVQAASCDDIADGTSDDFRQCAPPAVEQLGSVVGSISAGPLYGHIGAAGGGAPLVPPPAPGSQLAALPMSHAPDGMLVSGFTHGAQRSSAAQVSCGNRSLYCDTCGTHTLRQTPST